jgi:hypothetical protein
MRFCGLTIASQGSLCFLLKSQAEVRIDQSRSCGLWLRDGRKRGREKCPRRLRLFDAAVQRTWSVISNAKGILLLSTGNRTTRSTAGQWREGDRGKEGFLATDSAVVMFQLGPKIQEIRCGTDRCSSKWESAIYRQIETGMRRYCTAASEECWECSLSSAQGG